MSRYLVFSGWLLERGVDSLKGTYDTFQLAQKHLAVFPDFKWSQILDTQTGQVFENGKWRPFLRNEFVSHRGN